MRTLGETATRQRILQAAESCFAQSGYNGARLHRIAERVGIQKASLFHHFASKRQLYHAVLDEGFGDTEQTIQQALDGPGDALQKLRALAETYVDMVAAHPERSRILLRQALGDAPVTIETRESERLLRLVAAFVEQAQEAGDLNAIDGVGLVLSVVATTAFLFSSAPMIAPMWAGDPLSPQGSQRVKHFVGAMVERCLAIDRQAARWRGHLLCAGEQAQGNSVVV